MEKNVREMINDKRDLILSGKPLSKDTLANIGIELATLLNNVGDKMVELESGCYGLKNDWLTADSSLTDSKAETRMKASERWLEYRKAKMLYEATMELIRMIKTKIKGAENEWENI